MKIRFTEAPKGRHYKVDDVVEFKGPVEEAYAYKYIQRGWAVAVPPEPKPRAERRQEPSPPPPPAAVAPPTVAPVSSPAASGAATLTASADMPKAGRAS